MKHEYTDAILQAAIDAAFNTQSNVPWGSLDTRDKHDGHWKSESPARLALARALLDKLPEPTPPVSVDSQPAEVETPWTPKVGDVVRLKSGGDALTVTEYDAEKNQWRCVGLTGGCPCYLCVPLACLKPAAKEEQP